MWASEVFYVFNGLWCYKFWVNVIDFKTWSNKCCSSEAFKENSIHVMKFWSVIKIWEPVPTNNLNKLSTKNYLWNIQSFGKRCRSRFNLRQHIFLSNWQNDYINGWFLCIFFLINRNFCNTWLQQGAIKIGYKQLLLNCK